jgi:hypothetical protein
MIAMSTPRSTRLSLRADCASSGPATDHLESPREQDGDDHGRPREEGNTAIVKIIRSTETIAIDHPVFCWFGQPGICKTSLGYSMKDPLLLDFDAGAHRAANRRDTLVISTWDDISELMNDAHALAPYQTVVVDTVGRCLDLMTTDIIEATPKHARDGNLTQQGWGILRTRFRLWMTQLRTLGKDVALIAHQREDKDNDAVIVRPDIAGGSLGEVLKISDFLGFIYMRGKDRVLDFNPSDRWVAKNPAGWKPFVIPPIDKAQAFMADLVDQGRAALGAISAESAKIAQAVDDWRAAIAGYTTLEEINRAVPETGKLPAVSAPQVKKLLLDRAKALHLTWDAKKKAFVATEQPVRAATV